MPRPLWMETAPAVTRWGDLQAEAGRIVGAEALTAMQRTAVLVNQQGNCSTAQRKPLACRKPPREVRRAVPVTSSAVIVPQPACHLNTAGYSSRRGAAGLSSASCLALTKATAVSTAARALSGHQPARLLDRPAKRATQQKRIAQKKHMGYYMAPSGYCFSRGSFYALPFKIEKTW